MAGVGGCLHQLCSSSSDTSGIARICPRNESRLSHGLDFTAERATNLTVLVEKEMNEFETVKYNVVDGIAAILLNRPETRNSFNVQMRREMKEALEAANADDNVRVILIGGEGDGFCAGADLIETPPGQDQDGFVTRQLREEYAPIINAIVDSSKPMIGVVQGAAAGIGSSIAMACDMLLMAEGSFLYSAFGAIGLVPDGGAHYLLRNALGPKKAFEMIAFSQRITAEECAQLGIANRVVPIDGLWPVADRLAAELSKMAPLALKYSKQLLAEAAEKDMKSVMDSEAVIQNTCFRSEDFKEGAAAFFQKRKPQFKGH